MYVEKDQDCPHPPEQAVHIPKYFTYPLAKILHSMIPPKYPMYPSKYKCTPLNIMVESMLVTPEPFVDNFEFARKNAVGSHFY